MPLGKIDFRLWLHGMNANYRPTRGEMFVAAGGEYVR
jgi:hypothetical protein